MKPFKKFILLSFVFFSGFVLLALNLLFSLGQTRPIYSQGYIQLSENFDIHFTDIGISVSSPQTIFYSPEGIEIEPPFAAEDFINLPLGFSINRSTENYLLIEQKYIFSTLETPYKLIWQSENTFIKDIIEIGEFLLLVIEEADNFFVPYILDHSSGELTNLQGLNATYFLDAAIHEETGSFSILAFSDDGLIPSTRIFHYNAGAALYGALTLRDSLYFDLYRLDSTYILVGSDRVVCYNTNGDEIWAIEVTDAYRHSKIFAGDHIFLYFEHSLINTPNTLRISRNASKEWFSLPHGLTSLQSYSQGLIGVLNDNEVVVFNSSGELAAKIKPEVDITKLFYDKDLPDFIFILDRFSRLFTYTLFQPAELEDT